MPVICEASDGSELTNAQIDCGNGTHPIGGVCEYTNINNTPTHKTISCTAPQ